MGNERGISKENRNGNLMIENAEECSVKSEIMKMWVMNFRFIKHRLMTHKPKVLNVIIVICHHEKSCGFLCDRHRVSRKM